MELFEAIKERYSVRAYQDKPVSDADLRIILQAANDAPSAGNLQPYEIFIVRDAAARLALAESSAKQMFMTQAPIHIVFFANPDRNREKFGQLGVEFFTVQDATVAVAYAQLAATALGLGTCWIGALDDAVIHRVTGAPAHWRPMAILTLGYPAEPPKPRERRALSDLVREAKAGH